MKCVQILLVQGLLLHMKFATISGALEAAKSLNDFGKIVSHRESVYSFYERNCCVPKTSNNSCNRFGGFLAHLKTDELAQFVKTNYITGNHNYFDDGYWIGLRRGKEAKPGQNIWRWSDGTPLENEGDNKNWFKGDEPNDLGDEDCVSVLTSTRPWHRSKNWKPTAGFWADGNCNSPEKRYLCENVFGSGFLDRLKVNVSSNTEKINCTIFGDRRYNVTWTRDDNPVSLEKDAKIYQEFHEMTEYRTSIISFAGLLKPDDGSYVCKFFKEKTNFDNKVATIETKKFLEEPLTLPSSHKLSETRKISCSARGRPVPKMNWTVDDKVLQDDGAIASITITRTANLLKTESEVNLLNPISFGKDATLRCIVEGKSETNGVVRPRRISTAIILNTDLVSFDGKSFKVPINDETNKTENCNQLGGKIVIKGNHEECRLFASDMQEISHANKCEGSEIKVKIDDYTKSGASYQVNVSDVTQDNIEIVGDVIKAVNLKPRKNYSFHLRYKPDFWKSRYVDFSQQFSTKGIKPDKLNISRAYIKSSNKCHVEFQPQSPTVEFQLKFIQVKVHESGDNSTKEVDHGREETLTYVQGATSFEFKPGNFSHLFKARLMSCAGETGVYSSPFRCFAQKETQHSASTSHTTLFICGGILGLLVFVVIVVVIVKKRNSPKRSAEHLIDFTNSSTPRITVKQPQVNSTTPKSRKEGGQVKSKIKKTNLLVEYKKLIKNEKKCISDDFKKLKAAAKIANRSTAASRNGENPSRNRYKNIVPYDDTRVLLTTTRTDDVTARTPEVTSASDYINASWIDGYRQRRKYIATQGPKMNTIDDFWMMIYENKCQIVVMLTNLIEKGKKKCEQYWPDPDSPLNTKNFRIKFISEKRTSEFTMRTLALSKRGAKKKPSMVTQFHFVTWPDHGVPQHTTPILAFHRRVVEFESTLNEPTPMVVHCSAGVGRTGTFISLDVISKSMQSEDHVDFYKTVYDLRLQRMDMVQTEDQYVFLHRTIVELYYFGNTEQTFDEFLKESFARKELDKKLYDDFSRLNTIPVFEDSQQVAISGRELNLHNRDPTILPYDRNRIFIVPREESGDGYYNASKINNLSPGRTVLCGQTPLVSSVERFLNLVTEYCVSTIVMFQDKGQDHLYWSEKEGSFDQFGTAVVENVSVEKGDHWTTQKLVISSSDSSSKSKVEQIIFKSWDDMESDDDIQLLCSKLNKLVQHVDSIWKDNLTLLIHCRDGANFSGVLCALLQLNEKLKLENKIDLFRVVKDLRDQRPGMVRTLKEYKICHQTADAFIQNLQTYDNFL